MGPQIVHYAEMTPTKYIDVLKVNKSSNRVNVKRQNSSKRKKEFDDKSRDITSFLD